MKIERNAEGEKVKGNRGEKNVKKCVNKIMEEKLLWAMPAVANPRTHLKDKAIRICLLTLYTFLYVQVQNMYVGTYFLFVYFCPRMKSRQNIVICVSIKEKNGK